MLRCYRQIMLSTIQKSNLHGMPWWPTIVDETLRDGYVELNGSLVRLVFKHHAAAELAFIRSIILCSFRMCFINEKICG